MTQQCTKSAGHWRVGRVLGGEGRSHPRTSHHNLTDPPPPPHPGGGLPKAQAREQRAQSTQPELLVPTLEPVHTISPLHFLGRAWVWKKKLQAVCDGTWLVLGK